MKIGKPTLRGPVLQGVILLTVALAIAIGFFAVGESVSHPGKSGNSGEFSTYSQAKSGTMAYFELLTSLGFKAMRHSRPALQLLRKDANGVQFEQGALFMIAPAEKPTEDDVIIFKRLMANGFTLVIFSSDPEILAQYIGMVTPVEGTIFAYANDTIADVTVGTFADGEGVDKLFLPGGKRFTPWNGWETLAADGNGTVAVAYKNGAGGMVLVADEQMLTNDNIGTVDNAVFACRLADYARNNGAVYVDEYMHGYAENLGIGYLFKNPRYRALALQCLVFFGILLAAATVRFGQYRSLPDAEEGRILWFSEGMANLLADRRFSNRMYDRMKAVVPRLADINPTTRNARAAKALAEAPGVKPGGITRGKLRKLVEQIVKATERSGK